MRQASSRLLGAAGLLPAALLLICRCASRQPETPVAPAGPTWGLQDSTYTFTVSTTDPENESLKYLFEWNDGTQSWSGLVPSGTRIQMSHSWSTYGSYNVKVVAQNEHGLSSDSSLGHNIGIFWHPVNNPPATPAAPTGPASGQIDSTYSFTVSGTDPDNDSIRYLFDWGDSTESRSDLAASAAVARMSHSYSTAGTYSVRVMAEDERGLSSDWSPAFAIAITDSAPGLPRWSYRVNKAIRSSPAVATDGTIYFGSDDGYLDALNPDGTFKWQYRTFDAVQSSPAVAPDGTIYVVTDHGSLFAVSPSGILKWSCQAGYRASSSPAVAVDGTVYVASYRDTLYAVGPDGTIRWRFNTGDEIESSPAVAADGTICVGTDGGFLYAINPDSTLKWRYGTGKAVHSSPAIAADGTIYFGCSDFCIYAINPDSTLRWRYETHGGVGSSPVVGADGTVYVGSSDRHLYALNSDGALRWSCDVGGSVKSSPALAADGDHLRRGQCRVSPCHQRGRHPEMALAHLRCRRILAVSRTGRYRLCRDPHRLPVCDIWRITARNRPLAQVPPRPAQHRPRWRPVRRHWWLRDRK